MSGKLYAVCVPVLAVLALVVLPAVAQAAPKWEACKEVAKEAGKFTTDACTTEKKYSNFEWGTIGGLGSAVLVTSKNVPGTTIKMENVDKTFGIDCESAKGGAYLWNNASSGRGRTELEFTKCKASGELAECTVSEPIVLEAVTRLEEESSKIFNRYWEVSEEPLTDWITVSGAKCPYDTFGGVVTGTMRDEMTAHGNKQKLSGGETLSLFGERFGITAELEQEGPAKLAGIRVS